MERLDPTLMDDFSAIAKRLLMSKTFTASSCSG